MGSEPEQKRQIIGLTLQNLRIKNGKVLYGWVKPFDSIFKSAESLTWGRLWKEIRTALMVHYLGLSPKTI